MAAACPGASGLKGLLDRPGRRPVSIEDMNAALVQRGRQQRWGA